MSEQGLQKGSYQCTPAGIDQLEKDCKEYKMSSCTVDGIDQAQIKKAQDEATDKALSESKKQFEYTQKALSQVIDLPTAPAKYKKPSKTPSKPPSKTTSKTLSKTPSKTPSKTDNSTTYIIIFIVILCLLVLSSSSLAVFAMNKE